MKLFCKDLHGVVLSVLICKKSTEQQINAPVNVEPQGGGGGGGETQWVFTFLEARVKFPTPGHLVNVKF